MEMVQPRREKKILLLKYYEKGDTLKRILLLNSLTCDQSHVQW